MSRCAGNDMSHSRLQYSNLNNLSVSQSLYSLTVPTVTEPQRHNNNSVMHIISTHTFQSNIRPFTHTSHRQPIKVIPSDYQTIEKTK